MAAFAMAQVFLFGGGRWPRDALRQQGPWLKILSAKIGVICGKNSLYGLAPVVYSGIFHGLCFAKFTGPTPPPFRLDPLDS